MKRTFRIFQCGTSKMHFGTLFVICFLAAEPLSNGAPLRSARVSTVIRDVRLLPSNAAPRPAAVNDNVGKGTAVRTGIESRAELTFADLTITRLGENTVFSFNEAARELNVTKGAILLEVPSKAPAARINTAAVTAAVMGATALFATGPPTKFMMLEGIGSFYPAGHPERAVTVHAGEMVMMTGDGRVTQPTKFNVQLVLQTSQLIVGFPNLANLPLILQVVNQQLAEQAAGTSNPPPSKNSVVDVTDVLSQNVTANPAVVTFIAPSTPPGPPVITSPVPFVINSGTVIATHPTITTNGVTDMGVLYRGRAIDGPVSAFAFGLTSAFDKASGFDTQIEGKSPAAGFKFTSLQLTGNPTINTTNGPINLGLIAVNGITSGAPGGAITFAGLRGVLLATQKGSINLGPEISFSGLHDLNIYARGHGSDLTLGSDITNTQKVRLFVERDLVMTSSITTDDLYAFVGRNVVGNNLTVEVNNSMGGTIDTGGNIMLNAGGNLTVNGSRGLAFTIQNTTGNINDGGNINFTAGGSVSTSGEFSLLVENYDETANPAGHIGTGGNLSLSTAGNLTANFASIAINNRGGGTIDSSVDLSVNIGGALTTLNQGTDFLGNPSSFTVDLASRYDDTMGNTAKSSIGGNATVDFHADSIAINGTFNATLSDRGGTIGGNALLNFNTTHDITVSGPDITNFDAATFELLNDGGTADVQSPFGGTIHGDATLLVSAVNLAVPSGSLDVFLQNRNGGVIDGNATINFNLSGNLTVGQFASFYLTNHQNFASNGLPGGSIGSTATLDISAANVSVGADFAAQIFNGVNRGAPGPAGGSIGTNATLNITANSFAVTGATHIAISNDNNAPSGGSGGTIGGSATINFNIAGTASSGGYTNIQILNESVPIDGSGGSIGGNATINVSAGNVTADSLLVDINNSNGGSIGGNATINMNVSGTANVTTDATFEIFGSTGAAKGAAINFNGGKYGVGGTFLSTIDGDGAITFNNASIRADVLKAGVFGNNGTLTIGSGPLSANTLLKLYAPGSNGTLNFVANVTLSSGTFLDLAANTITIRPSVVVTIAGNGGPANIYTNNPNYKFTPGPGYTGPPGNPSNGSFGGNGARDPQPLANAPSFNASTASVSGGARRSAQTSSSAKVASSGKINGGVNAARGERSGGLAAPNRNATAATVNVANSAQLLSLLDAAVPGPGGKITIPNPNRINHSKNSNRSNVDGGLKANGGTAGARHVRDSADNPRLLASARSVAP